MVFTQTLEGENIVGTEFKVDNRYAAPVHVRVHVHFSDSERRKKALAGDRTHDTVGVHQHHHLLGEVVYGSTVADEAVYDPIITLDTRSSSSALVRLV